MLHVVIALEIPSCGYLPHIPASRFICARYPKLDPLKRTKPVQVHRCEDPGNQLCGRTHWHSHTIQTTMKILRLLFSLKFKTARFKFGMFNGRVWKLNSY